ncbi:hypothetical protein H5410_041260 [Solanum commersonii]|uniref:Uncharacterized protein n=1 Tax=Solanum commersonii TaxID=4109 RepID=A0A9J5XSJ0_SOLCO|nr:hypothetical protein H5410_041260 [Solanum commersonii]
MDANNSSANMFDGNFTPVLDSPDSDDFSNKLINFELSNIFEIYNWPVQQVDPMLVPHYSNYATNQVVNIRSRVVGEVMSSRRGGGFGDGGGGDLREGGGFGGVLSGGVGGGKQN